jgi:hypothetical protein
MKRIVIGIACLLLLVPLVVQTASLVHKFYDVEILHNLVVDNAVTAGSITVDNIAITGTVSGAGATAHRGALVFLGSSVSIPIGHSVIAFDNESYDSENMHSITDNTDKLTVPTGVTYVRLTGQVRFQSADNTINGHRQVTITKNGAREYIGAALVSSYDNTGQVYQNVSTAVVNVTAGDYFSMSVFTDNVVTVTGEAAGGVTWLFMEIVQ